jgi:hypothetical protein
MGSIILQENREMLFKDYNSCIYNQLLSLGLNLEGRQLIEGLV